MTIVCQTNHSRSAPMNPLPATAASIRVCSLAVIALSACNRGDATRAATDSALARDLALAGQQTQAAPTFQDTTIAPAPEPERIKERPAAVERQPAPRPRVQRPRAPQPKPQPQQ